MSKPIPFNIPLVIGTEQQYVQDAIARREFSGNGHYTKLAEQKLKSLTSSTEVLLTSSCTHALEMAAMLIDIQPGDEVIMSSYNFVSAANAFVLRGAKIVFVDIRLDTLNIDESLIEEAITERTKAILVMHYGGVPCEMDTIMEIASRNNIKVIEDAAHCIDSNYKGRHLGSIGDIGALSFHATKNIHCGEGGALLINNAKYIDRAHIIREKGTNRKAFIEGKVDKYTWVDIGSSYLMSEISAAFLYAQLIELKSVTENRLHIAKAYKQEIKSKLYINNSLLGNGHIYYFLLSKNIIRNKFISYLNDNGIKATFHYNNLRTSQCGEHNSSSPNELNNTVIASNSLVRLPLFCDLSSKDIRYIIDKINSYYD